MCFGRDLLSVAPNAGNALLHYYGAYAYIAGDQLVMMRPQQKAKLFEYDNSVTGGGVGSRNKIDSTPMAEEALSYLQLAEDLYLHSKYFYPPAAPVHRASDECVLQPA